LFKEKKYQKISFSLQVLSFCFLLLLFSLPFSFSSIFTSKSFEFFCHYILAKKNDLKRKKSAKKNQEDGTPFLLRSKKIHPENLLGLSCFANLN
jgi:predicted membrane protein